MLFPELAELHTKSSFKVYNSQLIREQWENVQTFLPLFVGIRRQDRKLMEQLRQAKTS
jgi:hypothetical protein